MRNLEDLIPESIPQKWFVRSSPSYLGDVGYYLSNVYEHDEDGLAQAIYEFFEATDPGIIRLGCEPAKIHVVDMWLGDGEHVRIIAIIKVGEGYIAIGINEFSRDELESPMMYWTENVREETTIREVCKLLNRVAYDLISDDDPYKEA